MKVRYIFDVKIPGEDHERALELHVVLQGALAEALQDEGLTTEGLKAVRLDVKDPTAPVAPGTVPMEKNWAWKGKMPFEEPNVRIHGRNSEEV